LKLAISILGVLAVCLGPSLVLAGLNDGLVAHYCFEGDATDVSGNGHDGTVTEAVWVPDRTGTAGGALQFDGVNDQVVVPYSSDFDLTTWTQIVWLKVTDFPEDITGWIMGKDGHNINFDMQIARESVTISSGYEDCSGNGINRNVFATGLSLDTWYFVASTRSNVEPYTERMYVGTLTGQVTQVDSMDFPYVPCTEENDDLTIGGANVDGTNRFFRGIIDDVWLYERVLTIYELEDLRGCHPSAIHTTSWGSIKRLFR
jgi:hypothetical protein